MANIEELKHNYLNYFKTEIITNKIINMPNFKFNRKGTSTILEPSTSIYPIDEHRIFKDMVKRFEYKNTIEKFQQDMRGVIDIDEPYLYPPEIDNEEVEEFEFDPKELVI